MKRRDCFQGCEKNICKNEPKKKLFKNFSPSISAFVFQYFKKKSLYLLHFSKKSLYFSISCVFLQFSEKYKSRVFFQKMPHYDFECEACKTHFWKSAPLGTTEFLCEQCGSMAKKVFSAPAVHFSGQGFYRTDSQQKFQNSNGSHQEKKSD